MSLIDAWGWEQLCPTKEPKKEEAEKDKCIKKTNCGYSFYVKCDCGAEFNVDSYYWDYFKFCPNCKEKMKVIKD